MEQQPLENGTAPSLIDRSTDGTAYEEPQGEAEQAIAKVWREIFGIDVIGRNDNFFELGGDSVLGMQLTERLTERLGIELPVVTLFLNPTIREMAEIAARVAVT
jgi:acyl carrier protein